MIRVNRELNVIYSIQPLGLLLNQKTNIQTLKNQIRTHLKGFVTLFFSCRTQNDYLIKVECKEYEKMKGKTVDIIINKDHFGLGVSLQITFSNMMDLLMYKDLIRWVEML
ncbi:unnamed protein product [Paramecium pentaurelia]|uniref:Uncharacterized protein n=1 Tax=Paramecium pentaurelia TaxID=43138 RepID=A0A8S1VAN6_9CILI|nr:unnamed protein product [Paramecium pentaurelia]